MAMTEPGAGGAKSGRGAGPHWALVWLVLALPALVLFLLALPPVLARDRAALAAVELLRWTGLVSCVLLAVALAITPLAMLTGGLRALRAQRRYIGVASFLYAALHLGYWMAENGAVKLVKSFVRPEILPGWIGFVILAAMAWTSTDAAMWRMGPGWKRLQRWVYPGAVLIFLHWLLTAETASRVLETVLISAPVILLSLWRFGWRRGGRGA